MKRTITSKTAQIWVSALAIFVCVSVTAVALTSYLNVFLPNDQGAISLIDSSFSAPTTPEEGTAKPSDGAEKPTDGDSTENDETPGDSDEKENGGQTDSDIGQTPDSNPGTPENPDASGGDSGNGVQNTTPSTNPGFEIEDDKMVWSTDTNVEIFRVSYQNGEQIVTVKSGNGDKVIAPGAKNSYTFKLKNMGDVGLDYTVEIDAYFSPTDIYIPVTGRLSRYDGRWVVGNKDSYAEVPALDAASDSGSLSAGNYCYYTLDWLWPFESGNDELDTMLGNLATEEDLSFTIVIHTTATENPNGGGGITPPQTGDSTVMWFTLAAVSFVAFLILLFLQNNKKRQDRVEENG